MVLWLDMSELKNVWKKEFGYKFKDITGLKIDESVIVLK
jgi:hypothetical protein